METKRYGLGITDALYIKQFGITFQMKEKEEELQLKAISLFEFFKI